MRNILNYQTAQDFTSSSDNNILPLTWWCDEKVQGESFNYKIIKDSDHQYYPSAFQAEYRGQVGEIIPGVAYIKESGATLYNSAFPLMVFNDYDYETHPWSEFGITQELIDKYIDAAKNRLYPVAFNVFIGNSPTYRINYNEESNWNYILIDCGKYAIQIMSDGTAKIKGMIE